ncbi:hypothetical protein [Salinispora tropica]|uniref:Uncharacterized protein n=1 Tax=Salinispora tropica (strain ATCC BAA-916 / DSM 44818 / JCM 13857 / NBRC 105044 / CNB-440) TaxID=369723 RepID=A4X100_SALTO|nr:hypothetical protein [Salinispora tropica]ABP52550.1 hypothetical protein Strop_0065 [Salinispora tropica CNB-440]
MHTTTNNTPSRSGAVAAATVIVPVAVFGFGYGLARNAELTAWIALVALIAAAGAGITQALIRVVQR